jgi:hypothetical protein
MNAVPFYLPIGEQFSERLVDRKLCTFRGVLWECVVKCMWPKKNGDVICGVSMPSHVE